MGIFLKLFEVLFPVFLSIPSIFSLSNPPPLSKTARSIRCFNSLTLPYHEYSLICLSASFENPSKDSP